METMGPVIKGIWFWAFVLLVAGEGVTAVELYWLELHESVVPCYGSKNTTVGECLLADGILELCGFEMINRTAPLKHGVLNKVAYRAVPRFTILLSVVVSLLHVLIIAACLTAYIITRLRFRCRRRSERTPDNPDPERVRLYLDSVRRRCWPRPGAAEEDRTRLVPRGDRVEYDGREKLVRFSDVVTTHLLTDPGDGPYVIANE
ncbi:ORF19 [Ictalurid herpesvirus 1]|nr:ORF19 [Ictalurid herpesvirus 1]